MTETLLTDPPDISPGEADIAENGDRQRFAQDLLQRALRAAALRDTPAATYRLQLNQEFTFADATRLAPYLHALGITHAYASPYFLAPPGSKHGYDVINHQLFNPEIGSEQDFEGWVSALRAEGMGHIVDFVPNHMGVATDANPWWQDVLENGPSSTYAGFFDIDWSPLKPDLANKVLLPVLGDQFGTVLENGELVLEFDQGAFYLRYYTRRFPITPSSYQRILAQRPEELAARLGSESPHFLEFQSILTAIRNLPPHATTDAEKKQEREREKEVIKRRLQKLCEDSPEAAAFIQENVALLNGVQGEPRSFDLLEQLLLEQPYRLAYWRVASDEINYRRFFDVNELAAVCMEQPDVFSKSHALVLRLIEEGKLQGLRIDHADGLYDPAAYLRQLQFERLVQLCHREYLALEANEADAAVSWEELEGELRTLLAAEPQVANSQPL
jgi:(1->4)-alpha-D-glucan 1-alpha-D-glucosylmutase